jgi:hypothetical protein
MALPNDKLEFIQKWRVNSALRSINLFDNEEDDCAVFEWIEILSNIQANRLNKSKLLKCAEEFIGAGLDENDYRLYSDYLEEKLAQDRIAQWHSELDSNPLVKSMREENKFVETTGRGKTPRYFELDVVTEQHGKLHVKGRYTSRRGWYSQYNLFWETKLPSGEKIKGTTIQGDYDLRQTCNNGFPSDWSRRQYDRSWVTSDTLKKEIFFLVGRFVIKTVERLYENPKPKRTRKRKVT